LTFLVNTVKPLGVKHIAIECPNNNSNQFAKKLGFETYKKTTGLWLLTNALIADHPCGQVMK